VIDAYLLPPEAQAAATPDAPDVPPAGGSEE